MSRYTIDRFEGTEWVVLEDHRARNFQVPREWLPADAREGDVLVASEENRVPGVSVLRFQLDLITRDQRLEDATRLRDHLPRGPKGDISL